LHKNPIMKNLLLLFSLIAIPATISVAQYPGAPEFGNVISSFNAGAETPTLDWVLFGAEYADGHIWVNGFNPGNSYQYQLYKFTTDGTLVDSYPRSFGFYPWKGIAYDGTYLYMANKDSLTEVSISTGMVTGNHIASPINPTEGVAYDPGNDRFWVTGYATNNIFEIDRQGNIYKVYPKLSDRSVLGLAFDTWSPGGPFLWTWSTVVTTDSSYMVADQLHIGSGSYTGTKMYGVRQTPFPFSIEYAAGFSMTDQILEDTITFVALQLGSYQQPNDQLDWVVTYNADLTSGAIPGPSVSTNPTFLENWLEPGDSTLVDIELFNDGIADLNWSARIEGNMPPGSDNGSRTLGDTLMWFDASALTPSIDHRLNGLEFANGKFWLTGRGEIGGDFKKIYSISSDGSTLTSVSNQSSLLPPGWSAIAYDGNFLYGADTYGITREYDIDSLKPTGNIIIRPSLTPDAFTYDPQEDHFWMGSVNGAILEFDRQGNEVNFFVTPYEIEGMAWDSWTPGGPYLWVWTTDTASTGAVATALRLDPETATPTAASFPGINLSNDPGQPDEAEAATITRDLYDDKLVFAALHNSTDSNDLNDKVMVYDLNVVPPPDWIELIGDTYGSVTPGGTGILTVKLKAIMEDTVMTAGIKISSNDIINPEVLIPVNVTMQLLTALDEGEEEAKARLWQNEPNPFTDQTRVRFSIADTQNLTLRIYDQMGNLVAVPVDRQMQGGTYEIYINGFNLKPGIYYYTLSGEGFVESRKMVIAR